MAEGKPIDLEELRRKVMTGATVDELIGEWDPPDPTALSRALLHLLRGDTEIRKEELAEAIGKKYAVNPKYEKEGIVIRPQMLEETPFQEGDEFKITMDADDRIVLTRVAVESVGPL